MSDFKGTPGPWEWDSEDGILARHEDIGIGSVFPCDPCRYRKGEFEYGAVTESNARLIAAAPDLLEACQTFAEWLRREEEGLPDGIVRGTPEGERQCRIWWEENLRICNLAQQQVRAAIAKATGEQP